MKLSFVIELLLIFLLIAFAASRVIETRDSKALKSQQKQDNAPNRYCSCSTDSCDCCREFALPVIPIKGPGCASLQYVKGDNMALTLKFGDRVLATHTISGKRPKPVCMRLPGGFSKFCGRVYGISREPDSFHACLGLEIRALDDLEAALRVSCFRFSPEGLRLEPAKPLPAEEEDDEDEDDYGFGDDSEEEDDDEEEEEEDEALGGASEDEEEDDDIAAGVGDDNEISADYAGFSILGDLLGLDDESAEVPVKKKPNKKTTSTPPPVQVPTQTPHKVIVQVHHIHDATGKPEVIVQAPEPVVTNNKVMDKVETTTAPATTAKPTKAPTKVPNRGTTKAPSKPAAKPTTSAPIQAETEESSMVTVMNFSPSTSSEYTVNVVQDGQPLQTMDDTRTPDAATESESMVGITTTMAEETMTEEGEKIVEVSMSSPDVMVAADEAETEDDKQEVDIGVVKDEEVTAAALTTEEETSKPATAATTTAAPPAPSTVAQTEKPTPAPQTVAVPTSTATAEKDEDDADADDVVEEVEDAVATVFSAGVDDDDDDEEEDDEEEEDEAEEAEKEEEDKEEDEEEEESEEEEDEEEEEETEKPQGDEEDSTYDDDEEDDEDDEKGEAVTEIPTTTVAAEKRWRRRKNRLDHIFWK